MIFFILKLDTSLTAGKYYHIHSKLSSTDILIKLYQLIYIILSYINRNRSILVIIKFEITVYQKLLHFSHTSMNVMHLIRSTDFFFY